MKNTRSLPSKLVQHLQTAPALAQTAKKNAVITAAAALFVMGMDWTPEAKAAQFFVNDGTDTGCARMYDSASGAVLAHIDSSNCTVASVNDITESLGSGEAGGYMVLNSNGLFLNNKMQINGTFSTNGHKLIDIAAGTDATDGVNLSQISPLATVLGATIDPTTGAVTVPAFTLSNGGTQTTVGGALAALDSAITTNTDSIASLASQLDEGSVGLVQQDEDTRAITVAKDTDGDEVDFSGTSGDRVLSGVAAGVVSASSNQAINGSQLYATAYSVASALGGGATVNADGTVSTPTYTVGGTTVSSVADAISSLDTLVGANTSAIAATQAAVANAVMYDSSAQDTVTLDSTSTTTRNSVTLGSTEATSTVQLTNLADAELSASSTDAVTGAQLYETNLSVAGLSEALDDLSANGTATATAKSDSGAASATGSNSAAVGGGATASGDNATAIGDSALASASGATALGSGTTASATSATAIGTDAQASAANSVALGANSVANEANTVSVGSAGNERRITNVADGVNGTDAVNMRQFQQGLGDVSRKAYSGVASATALSMIPDVDAGKTVAVGVGTANYQGYQAAAIGASARINQRMKVRVGAAVASAGTTWGAGASYQW